MLRWPKIEISLYIIIRKSTEAFNMKSVYLLSSMGKHIGLFFGSFNPVHTGHLIIANYMVEHTDMDEVWMVVSPHNPFKQRSDLAHEKDRYKMIQLALSNHKKIKASNVEFNLSKPSYTINTVKHLTTTHPNHLFSIIIGSDNLKRLPNWKSAKSLIRNHKFYVYKRSGYQLGTWKDHNHVLLLKAPVLNISATYVRSQIAKEKSIDFLVHDSVKDYIVKKTLYQK